MRKVLVIGSLGMLGRELTGVFGQSKDYSLTSWDVNDIDISDKAQVLKKISALAPHLIINAAAYNDVDKAEDQGGRKKAFKINGYAPGYLAKVARSLNAVFIHYSSDYVFDGKSQDGYAEDSRPNPISHYGESKFLGENKIKENCDRFYIVRLQRLFGLPGTSDQAKKSFFSKMIEMAKVKKEITVVDSELGNFTYAPDLARRTKYLFEHRLPFGIYHITNEGCPVTWFGAAKILFDLFPDLKIKLIPVLPDEFKRPARRPRYVLLLNTKLHPMRRWPDALKEFLSKQKRR